MDSLETFIEISLSTNSFNLSNLKLIVTLNVNNSLLKLVTSNQCTHPYFMNACLATYDH